MRLRLKEFRQDMAMSVAQMSKETGISVNTLHLYERGSYPSIKQIETIAKTYDVNPAWLLGWAEDEKLPEVKIVEKVIYKESPVSRIPEYFNNNNNGRIIKWKQSRSFLGGRV